MDLQSLAQHSACAVHLRACQLIRLYVWVLEIPKKTRTTRTHFPSCLFYFDFRETVGAWNGVQSMIHNTLSSLANHLHRVSGGCLFDPSPSPSIWGSRSKSILDSFDIQISLQETKSHTCLLPGNGKHGSVFNGTLLFSFHDKTI